jgi:hypothetical protein
MNGADTEYAVTAIRDQFLIALDNHDRDLVTRLALRLASCGNPLPTSTCRDLGIPAGSSYGSAARAILAGDVAATPTREG